VRCTVCSVLVTVGQSPDGSCHWWRCAIAKQRGSELDREAHCLPHERPASHSTRASCSIMFVTVDCRQTVTHLSPESCGGNHSPTFEGTSRGTLQGTYMFHLAPSIAAAGVFTTINPCVAVGTIPKPVRRKPHTANSALFKGSNPTRVPSVWFTPQYSCVRWMGCCSTRARCMHAPHSNQGRGPGHIAKPVTTTGALRARVLNSPLTCCAQPLMSPKPLRSTQEISDENRPS
jgi:hypothetical protein